ncbi:uncharacterized protein TNCV_2300311 [Trichonephila clavipes]|nr:uncharacterized protein TNCV_2300311 [Trichonephila clavipes]
MKDKRTLKRHKTAWKRFKTAWKRHKVTCKRQEKMEDTHTNDVIPSEEHNHIMEQVMTEALPTSNKDNSAHQDGSEKQDKRLTDTVDQHSFDENITSQLLSEK